MKKTEPFRSLRVTLRIAFLALATIILLVSSSMDLYGNFHNQQKVFTGLQQLIAQNAANSVKAFIQEKTSVLGKAANIGNMANARKQEQTLVMEKLLGGEPAFR
ncbi:MAG: hypothetical protein V1913_02045, partial [Fibrobacterota bacterium]